MSSKRVNIHRNIPFDTCGNLLIINYHDSGEFCLVCVYKPLLDDDKSGLVVRVFLLLLIKKL